MEADTCDADDAMLEEEDRFLEEEEDADLEDLETKSTFILR